MGSNKPPANDRVAKIAAKQALDDIVGSLQDLIRNELSEFSDSTLADLANEFGIEQPKAKPNKSTVTQKAKKKQRNEQQLGLPEFDSDDPEITFEMDAPEPDVDEENDDLDSTLDLKPASVPKDTPAAKQDFNINNQNDGIPVLDEIISAPEPKTKKETKDIYKAAIKAAARFNVEQRKLGETELKAKAISRLAILLREELE